MISRHQLKSLRLFKEVSDSSCDALASIIEEKKFDEGVTILSEGETSGSLYVIANGLVSVSKKIDRDGIDTKSIARLGTEEIFGEMAFLENQPHSASVVALTDTTLWILPRKRLNEVLAKDPSLALEQILTVFSGLSARLRVTTTAFVTVYEVARIVSQPLSVLELVLRVFSRLKMEFGEHAVLHFYRWNPFNEEYTRVGESEESGGFPETIDGKLFSLFPALHSEITDLSKQPIHWSPLALEKGHLLLSRSDQGRDREGVIICYSSAPFSFTPSQRQLLETVSSILAPALATVRQREEELARQRYEQGRQQGLSL